MLMWRHLYDIQLYLKITLYILILYYLYIFYDSKIKIVSVVMKLLAIGRPL